MKLKLTSSLLLHYAGGWDSGDDAFGFPLHSHDVLDGGNDARGAARGSDGGGDVGVRNQLNLLHGCAL